MSEKYKPYVVSADTSGLMEKWGAKNNFVIPDGNFYQENLTELELILKRYFSDVEIISEQELENGLNEFVQTSPYQIVSLDRAYIDDKSQSNLMGFLDATRTIDTSLKNIGLNSRVRKISLQRQIASLAKKANGNPIALLDDVIFEGNTMLQLIKAFRKRGVNVDKVYTGIAIQGGISLLEKNGVQVESVVNPYQEVVDEICERDFRVGAPYSGRAVIDNSTVKGAPYVLPFGKPVEWASIPKDDAVEFSLFCLTQSLLMWLLIEKLSRQSVSTKQLPRQVYGLTDNDSVVLAIRKKISSLEKGGM